MGMYYFHRVPGLSISRTARLIERAHRDVSSAIADIETELCFYVWADTPLSMGEVNTVTWLLSEVSDPGGFSETSFFDDTDQVIEVGPRLNFSTAWSTNAVSIFHSCGISKISRIERSRRFRIVTNDEVRLDHAAVNRFLPLVHDRMTETRYGARLLTFDIGLKPTQVFTVPVIEEGRSALERINRDMGLGFDERDLDYYTRLFAEDIGRNPTNVECFDMGQSNSEHSRHWFFQGNLVIDGVAMPDSLLKMVKDTWRANPNNSIIAFQDNSSAIRGFDIRAFAPSEPGSPSAFARSDSTYHIIFTAETHNFPTGVAPFPGAETGTGGRIRDVQATGIGGIVTAGTAAYCVGNLRVPGYELPWEDSSFAYPGNLASPLEIEIEASNGASDYGNKFGEPVIQGMTRSFGMRLPGGERREWIKPIMFTGGVGQMDARHAEKSEPETGMWVVKIGGPAYRIGMGGGAASSMIQGENAAELDFNAVQRGDAEMEQKVNRVIRACVELGARNPIVSIHDQGAGGNCNVVKELVYPAGGRIEVRDIPVGDSSLSVLEIWGAEYQENNALLVRNEHLDRFATLCVREKAPFSLIGRITGDGKIVLHDDLDDSCPVNLDLEKVLGEMPKKTFIMDRAEPVLKPLELPEGLTVRGALERVLRLLSVGSKRFLASKVDRSVTGLVARQQNCGPLQLTVSDVAVIAQSYFGVTGAAIAIGEQPVKGLVNPAAMARMSVGEALTNIIWAATTGVDDIRCSANWMWAAKLPGEGAALHDAVAAMAEVMKKIGVAVDGGKDSLSMAAVVAGAGGRSEVVKSPGTLVVSAYVTCPDITLTVTPDIKRPGASALYFIDFAHGANRLGGSALAQVFSQVGDESPDLDDPAFLASAFCTVQGLVMERMLLAGHDRSDGGLVTTLLEMAFSGDCGFDIDMPGSDPIAGLFSEELGLVVEIDMDREGEVVERLATANLPALRLGVTTRVKRVVIRCAGSVVLNDDMIELRDVWEETSFRLEALQTDPAKALEERKNIRTRTGPIYVLPFTPEPTPPGLTRRGIKPGVAIVREEGSNGDREMAGAFHMAGFEAWDVTMTDLLSGRITLDGFRGVAFVGGFSFADVMDSAKGWAGAIRFNENLRRMFDKFYSRPDTFSLGVCNGCQLMAQLGWVPFMGTPDASQPRLLWNDSGRLESRFATVRIFESPSIMLRGMEGAVLGVWVNHGEGRIHFPDRAICDAVIEQRLSPVRYADDDGRPTNAYPFNPNGSPDGMAALCSPDGRHLAMMPHPERAFLKWQWGWMPEEMKRDLKASPWLRLFGNARAWCDEAG